MVVDKFGVTFGDGIGVVVLQIAATDLNFTGELVPSFWFFKNPHSFLSRIPTTLTYPQHSTRQTVP
jgi:hypothetical protein